MNNLTVDEQVELLEAIFDCYKYAEEINKEE